MSDPIATNSFIPWLRHGIASKIRTEDKLGLGAEPVDRALVRISLQVNGDPKFVSKDVQLMGPGDVIGISPRAVVRTEPRNWVTDFELNYLAFIEFYEEDFPWRFTPARAVPVDDPKQTKLRPWIFLLVLEEGEFNEAPSLPGPLPSIQLSNTAQLDDILPPPEQTWAWAHVHVSQDVTSAGANAPQQSLAEFQKLVHQNPDNATSRVIAPRKLKPSKAYHAFLIPAFEVGRLAGLGLPTENKNALLPSWGSDQVEYPVYYRWYFRTGELGDFESLVKLLEPREVDPRVGVRDMDMQNPNFGVAGMSDGHGDIPVIGLEGALKSPEANPKPVGWPPNQTDAPAFLNQLQQMVNLQDMLLNLPANATNPDPVISPPLYGSWHAMQTRLDVGHSGWVNDLNQDPRLRVSAGFGTKVVQAGQESYMERAWQQLGDILSANQKIRQVQVSIATSMRVYARHFVQLDPDQQIAVTQQLHVRVMNRLMTVRQELQESKLEAAALKPALRRILRPRGAIMRKAIPKNLANRTNLIVKLNEGQINPLSKVSPAKLLSITRTANNLSIPELRESNLKADVVARIPALPDYRLSLPGQLPPPMPVINQPLDSPDGRTFRGGLIELHSRLEITLPTPGAKPKANLSALGDTLVKALNPKSTILQRALSTISIPDTFQYLRPKETIVPIMAHPVFADPMYKPLRDLSSELLIPNLNLIPNNTVTLLETNPRFIEAYMVGLNHEMARELLWNEFPTDQRGSYFRQFWDVGEIVNRDPTKDPKDLAEELLDIQPLHLWKRNSDLGSHANRKIPSGKEQDEKRLVLVIKGDVLKKYPSTVIYAQKAQWVDDENDPTSPRRKIRVLDKGDPKTTVQEPIFKAQVEPDLHFLGFNLTVTEAKGNQNPPGEPGWFFVLQERPGEPHFGLDITAGPVERQANQLDEWNQLTWNHLGNPDNISLINLSPEVIPAVVGGEPDRKIKWGTNAADMAYILFQAPVMVAIHADMMLK